MRGGRKHDAARADVESGALLTYIARLFPVVVLFVWLLAPTGAAAAEQTTFYSLPTATHATALTLAADGNLWFVGEHSLGMYKASEPLIGRVSPNGEIKEYPLPKDAYPHQLVGGPGGDLWFTSGEGGTIARFSPSGELSKFRVGAPSSGPYVKDGSFSINGIATGLDGNLWFTAGYWQHGKHFCEVGRLTPAGEVTAYALAPHAGPLGIVSGPDGNLWFPVSGRKSRRPAIVRITPGGEMTRFPLPPRPNGSSYTGVGEIVVGPEIVRGPDGNLWFGAGVAHLKGGSRRAKLGRLSPSGEFSEFTVPGNEAPKELTAGPGGLIWFATHESRHGYEVDSIAPNGVAGTPSCLKGGPSCELAPYALAEGPEDALWFAAGKRGGGGYGGGGSGQLEAATIAQEAGFVGQFVP